MIKSSLPSVLLIETGGTITHTKGKDKVLRPSEQSVLSYLKEIDRHARVSVDRLPIALDSTNMLHEQRVMIAQKIYDNARKYDGFVVVHGTDTMPDTAAALTMMVQGLGKPIVLTGAQLPIWDVRTDALNNLYSAIITATQDYGEVLIAFGGEILRGSRAIKESSEDFHAFSTPRVAPIGKGGINVEPLDGRITRKDAAKELRFFPHFDTNIGFFYLMSGVGHTAFASQVKSEDLHGFVLVGFGAGNIPEVYYDSLKYAQDHYKPVVVVTQCIKGSTNMGLYEASAKPLELGVISGGDMTMQMVTQKLMYGLGKAEWKKIPLEKSIEFVQDIIQKEYAKEVDMSSFERLNGH